MLPDPLEAVLLRSRRSVEELFRRYALSDEEACTLLIEALPRIESLQGAVPGAGHRLIKLLDAACRRARPQERTVPADRPSDYRKAFDAAAEHLRRRRRTNARERGAQAALLAEIEELCARNGVGPASHLPPLPPSKELLVAILDRAYDLRKTDPRLSLALARVALGSLQESPMSKLHDRLRADLEARGYTVAGNACRLLYDYRSAEREFSAAQAALGRGTQDPRERAGVLVELATLRRDQRHFDEALRQFQQAAAIYRWTQEHHLEGQTYARMAICEAYAGRPELAIPLADRATELLDPERDPRLAAGLVKNMVHFLCWAGRAKEARERVQEARELTAAWGTESDLRGLRWIEGQIAFALGEAEEGERLLLGVRDEFIAARNLYDTALVSLELAAEYLDQGRTADAKRLAEETLPIFQSLEVHREALAALIAVQRAIELETATSELVRELLAGLQRVRNGPPPRPEQPS